MCYAVYFLPTEIGRPKSRREKVNAFQSNHSTHTVNADCIVYSTTRLLKTNEFFQTSHKIEIQNNETA